MIPFQKPVKFGLISAFVMIILTVIMYVLGINMFSIAFSLISLVLFFGLMITITVIGVNKLRDEDLQKKITYLQALLGGTIILLISMYLSGIFNYLLNGIIDPQYMSNMVDDAIIKYEDMNLPEEQLNDIKIKFEEAKDATAAFKKSIWMSPLMSIVIAAIIALFIKKDKTGEIPV
jgi:hypothetical protein